MYEDENVVTKRPKVSDEGNDETNMILIIIPSIVAAVLVIVAISILVHFCNKKRAKHQIIIKETLSKSDCVAMNEVETHQYNSANVQYIMDADEKENIFARPKSE